MSEFGRRTYGQPCHECGFSWDISLEGAQSVIANLPRDFEVALAGARGDERYGDAPWNVAAYVWHVADNVRIWSDRVVARALDHNSVVVPYDQDALAHARGYNELNLSAVLWALDRATGDWTSSCALLMTKPDAALEHPEMGRLPLRDAASLVAHDATHHVFDVRRALGH